MNELTIREKIHSLIHFIALAGTATGLTFSKAVMSLALVLGIVNLFATGQFKSIYENLRSSRPFHLIALLYCVHIIALFWSHDLAYGINDLRIKLPLLVLPVILFAKPPSQHQLKLLLYLFIAGLLSTTVFNYLAFNELIGNYKYDDIRGLSLFGSHIRFGILVAIGALICLYYLVIHDRFKALHLVLFIWFAYYTYFSQIISGNFALLTGILGFIFFQVFQKNRKIAVTFLLLSTILPILVLSYFFLSPSQKVEVNEQDLPKETIEGNPYTHDFVEHRDTKGNLLYINLSDDELKREWAKVSDLSYDGKDMKEQPVRTTLIRYMTSMGLMKDAEGFSKLTPQDIKNIERGIAENEDGKRGLIARINGIKYQLNNNHEPNGHSLLQRVEYWRTGWNIIQSNWVFGVGTGDVQAAFNQQYEQDNSLLREENRKRAHHQFLTFWISFGIIGLAIFLYLIWNYLQTTLKKGKLIGFVFMLIACSSFLLEDTLETQTGVTLFAFFYSVFLLLEPRINLQT